MIRKIALALIALVLGVATIAMPAPAMADSTAAKTAILKTCANDDGNGSGIMCLLKQGLEILSWIIGALGFAALVFVGFQYLTAGDNEEQVRKSKRRIVEIVVGVALFLLANVIVQWLTGDDPTQYYNDQGGSSQQSNNGANR